MIEGKNKGEKNCFSYLFWIEVWDLIRKVLKIYFASFLIQLLLLFITFICTQLKSGYEMPNLEEEIIFRLYSK